MPKIEKDPNYELTTRLVEAYKKVFLEQQEASGTDPVKYSQLSVVALTALAGTVAVDINMPYDNFGKVCQANYAQAYQKAPRFS